MPDLNQLQEKADDIRDIVVDVAYQNGSSHVGSCLSCIEILVYLYYYKMRQDDIFILSKGHAALALYAILFDIGLITMEELYDYPHRLGGHVPYKPKKGLMAATGSLGHGIGMAIGYAIANPQKRVYCLCGDGEAQEGSFYETINVVYNLGLSNIHIMIDQNGWAGFQAVDTVCGETVPDGHDMANLDKYLSKGAVIMSVRTAKGKGIPRMEDTLESHYLNISKEDYDRYIRSA